MREKCVARNANAVIKRKNITIDFDSITRIADNENNAFVECRKRERAQISRLHSRRSLVLLCDFRRAFYEGEDRSIKECANANMRECAKNAAENSFTIAGI